MYICMYACVCDNLRHMYMCARLFHNDSFVSADINVLR